MIGTTTDLVIMDLSDTYNSGFAIILIIILFHEIFDH